MIAVVVTSLLRARLGHRVWRIVHWTSYALWPVVRLVGYLRVPLDPGESAYVTFGVPADLASFTGVHGQRIVEPGDVELRFARSSSDVVAAVPLRLVGDERQVGHDRRLLASARADRIPSPGAPWEVESEHI